MLCGLSKYFEISLDFSSLIIGEEVRLINMRMADNSLNICQACWSSGFLVKMLKIQL